MVRLDLGVGKWSRLNFWIKIVVPGSTKFVDLATHLTQQNQSIYNVIKHFHFKKCCSFYSLKHIYYGFYKKD